MSRLIDADALMIELMDSDLDHLQRDDWKEVIQIVADAPTIIPEPHWISCSERLPIEYDIPTEFLCTLELEHKNGVRYVDLIMWNGSDWENNYTDDNKYSDYGIDKVIAWMPKPESYKGVTE